MGPRAPEASMASASPVFLNTPNGPAGPDTDRGAAPVGFRTHARRAQRGGLPIGEALQHHAVGAQPSRLDPQLLHHLVGCAGASWREHTVARGMENRDIQGVSGG